MRFPWGAGLLGPVLATVLFGFFFGTGLLRGDWVIIVIAWLAVAYFIGKRAKTERDPWLPGFMTLAMTAKLFGCWLRYFVRLKFYDGGGDAGRYHRFGLEVAEIWRAFEIPDIWSIAFGSEGTRFTAWIIGLLYAPYQPDQMGGYWIFGLLAFLGQFALYLAFRHWAPTHTLKRYAILLFFWPTILYWPSSIGKEGLIMLPLGVGAWGIARLYKAYRFSWIPIIAASIFVIGIVRVHVAALLAGSAVAAVLLTKAVSPMRPMLFRRLSVILLGGLLMVPLAVDLGQEFNLDVNASIGALDLEPAFDKVTGRTQQGGSAVEDGAIRSVVDIPRGIARVLFRPFLHEVSNIPQLAASLEGILLMGLIIWRAPKIGRHIRTVRESPYLIFCVVYCFLFVWAWSAVANLGIMARQRSLVLPFLFAIVAGLGWEAEAASPEGKVQTDIRRAGEYPQWSQTNKEMADRME